ncbi:MAG TPA: helix-turn-helix domain-containing protein [Polyangiaceae bacterium]|nr:helix-turn-helix domain-containing protein [Polyangiaceae bacterium]
MKPRDEAKARDILAATLKEVEAVGLAGLSMEAVARRAKVATGTLYIYFKNKEALIDALYLATKRELAGLVFKPSDLPVRAAFQAMCVAFLEYLIEHQAEVIFMGQVFNSPYISDRTRAEAALGVRPLTELLERGQRELLLKDLDVPLMLVFLQGTLRELAAVVAAEPRARRAERCEQIATLCWDALKA